MNAREEKEYAELMKEFQRVGIGWDAFAETDRRNAPNEPPTPDGAVALELNYRATTEFLKSLPDGAGQDAFLAAWDKKFGEPVRRRLEAAMRLWARKKTGKPGNSGAPGA